MAFLNLRHRFPLAVDGYILRRTQDGMAVRDGSIIDTYENPNPPPPRLMRAQAVGPGGYNEGQLTYTQEQDPTNDQLVMFGQLPVNQRNTLRSFAECFPHLVRYTNDTCDKIVIVRERFDGEMIVLHVVPVTALARHPLENIFDRPVAPAAFGRELEAQPVAPAAFGRELEAPPAAPIGQARRW